MRNLVHHSVEGKNSLRFWHRAVHPLRVVLNFLIIQFCRYSPSLKLKNPLYRILGMKVGKNVSFGLMAMMDVFFPQMITIGENSILGYNCTLLCHEFLIHEYRTGPIVIGKDAMIGANATILPGVTIGDRAVVGAGAVVAANVPADTTVFGIPAKPKELIDDQEGEVC
ncbi:acyltransferase [Dehalobacterium formicoaceticum]|uniref:acyltransferase n=1 Tax=Dehalobacterium formicoaceticum TaxID=51515 RepID=UPI000B7DAB02|nr:DapH/DapD/GlmU-related protein [Dehalobacterium formicoaceticum]